MSSHKTASDHNPFRYRGYYYDRETGFYYLQSRYYDPANILTGDARAGLGAIARSVGGVVVLSIGFEHVIRAIGGIGIKI